MRVRYLPVTVGLLFCGVVLIVWVGRRPTPSPIRVMLVGTTNDSSGARLYCFQATNAGAREFIVSYQPQILLPSGDFVTAQSSLKHSVFNAVIPAGMSRAFAFPAPEEEAASWRILLFYDYPLSPWRAWLNRLGRAVGLSRQIVNEVSQQKAYSQTLPKK